MLNYQRVNVLTSSFAINGISDSPWNVGYLPFSTSAQESPIEPMDEGLEVPLRLIICQSWVNGVR